MTERLYGLSVCILLGLISMILGQQVPVVGGPVFGIVLGILLGIFWKDKTKAQPGISFVSKKVLQYAVIMLGFGLNIITVFQVGVSSLPIILSTIFVSLAVAALLYRVLPIKKDVAVLIGVGSSICGGSAIAITAPVIQADEKDVAQSIAVIFLFNVIAALIFPSLGDMIGLSNYGFALFAGTAINDTSSVTAAATAWDALHENGHALEFATIVKLTRTLAIIPITLVLAYIVGRRKSSEGATKHPSKVAPFPKFIIYFLGASLITTGTVYLGVSATMFSPVQLVSKGLITIAMVGIGLQTDLKYLFRTGGQAIVLGLACWICIALMSLFMQSLLGTW